MRVVFLCSEFEGLLKTGGLADATRGLAMALKAMGHQVEIIMPRYGALYSLPVKADWQSIYFELGDHPYGCAVRHLEIDGLPIHLIEHHDFFARPRPYDDGNSAYPDNALRFAFFCKAALSYLQQRTDSIDIVHGHDWQTGLAACYLKSMKAGGLQHTRFVLTVHNAAYQQGLSQHDLAALGLADWQMPTDFHWSMLSLGLWQADKLNTVSQGYRQELLSEPAANGLAKLYQARETDFVGILNGCDYGRWDPSQDYALVARYDENNLSGKALCKAELLRQAQLPNSQQTGAELPLFVSVSRITGQKGFSYLIPALKRFLSEATAQVVLMGTGELQFIQPLRALEQEFPQRFRLLEGFDEPLSHQVEAAGDFFLMPSLFEPCGLNQIYSLRYGTVPIVRATGGLRDTVIGEPAIDATGLSFEEPTVEALLSVLQQAVSLYRQPKRYLEIQQRGMTQIFSWQKAASQYEQLYLSAIG